LGASRVRGRLRRIDDLVRQQRRRRDLGCLPRGAQRRAVPQEGWPVALAYVVGFFAMLLVLGFRPAVH
jgi:hypothetical protein